MQIHVVSRVIYYQAILLAFVQTQTTAHNLLIQAHGLGRTENRDKVHMGRVKTRGEHGHIHQIL